jgi:hypothetical protein
MNELTSLTEMSEERKKVKQKKNLRPSLSTLFSSVQSSELDIVG